MVCVEAAITFSEHLEVYMEKTIPEAQPTKTPIKTIVVDTITSLGEAAMRYALTLDAKRGLGGSPAQQHYGPEIWNMRDFIQRGCQFDGHFVVLSHERYEKDELTGAVRTVPSVDGRWAATLAKDFDEYYRALVRTKSDSREFLWQTVTMGAYAAKTTRGFSIAKMKPIFEPYEVASFKALEEKCPGLSDTKTRWLIYGPAGIGKSVNVITSFPRPMVVLDFDNKADPFAELDGVYIMQFGQDKLHGRAVDFIQGQAQLSRLVAGAALEDLQNG